MHRPSALVLSLAVLLPQALAQITGTYPIVLATPTPPAPDAPGRSIESYPACAVSPPSCIDFYNEHPAFRLSIKSYRTKLTRFLRSNNVLHSTLRFLSCALPTPPIRHVTVAPSSVAPRPVALQQLVMILSTKVSS